MDLWQYADKYLPAEEFAPAAIEIAKSSHVSAWNSESDNFISAHWLVTHAGHPEASPRAALYAGDTLLAESLSSGSAVPSWLEAAKEFYRFAVEFGNPAYTGMAAEKLASAQIPRAAERIRGLEEGRRREEASYRAIYYPY